MTDHNEIDIAEIPHESGAVKFRYARVLAPDRSRWIRHGFFVAYYEDGTPASEGAYADGKEEGVWRDFHENGTLASEGTYRGGEKSGNWRYWRADGTEEPGEQFGGA